MDIESLLNDNDGMKNKLKKQFDALKDKPIHTTLSELSQMALPFVMMLKLSGIEEQINDITSTITPNLKNLDQDDLQQIRTILREAKKEKIQKSIQETAASIANYDKALKSMQDQKDFMDNVPEEVHIAASQALSDVIPKSLQTTLAVLSGQESIKSTKKAIRANRKKIQKTPVQQLAAERVLSAAAIPTKELSDMIYDMIQRARPESLGIFVEHIADNLSTEDYNNVANGALNFVEELGKASAAGQFWQVTNPDNVTGFAQSLKKVMHTIDEGMDKAGITSNGALANMQTTLKNNKNEMMGVLTVKPAKPKSRTPKR